MKRLAAAAAFATVLAAGQALGASVLYKNGPTTSDVNAYTIANGFSVANPFTLTRDAQLTDVSFVGWTYTGYTPSWVQWTILDNAPSQSPNVVASGTGSLEHSSVLRSVSLGGGAFDVRQYAFEIAATLKAGVYWLALYSPVNLKSERLLWDLAGGPPAEQTKLSTGKTAGVQGSSFALFGVVPEPSTWAVMILGFGLIGARLRRRPAIA